MKYQFFTFISVLFASYFAFGNPNALRAVKVVTQVSGTNAEESNSIGVKNSVLSKTSNSQKTNFPEPPRFKDNEYAIFLEDSYKIFKTKNFESLELTENCFKSGVPHCQAYEFSQIKPKKLIIKYPGLDNISAIHCEEVGGRNLLALDNKNNHYNFCRFGDGTMVNSWSMHYKQFPTSKIK